MTNKKPYFSSIEAQQNGTGIRSQGLLRFCLLLPWYAESGLIRSTTLAVPKHMQTVVPPACTAIWTATCGLDGVNGDGSGERGGEYGGQYFLFPEIPSLHEPHASAPTMSRPPTPASV